MHQQLPEGLALGCESLACSFHGLCACSCSKFSMPIEALLPASLPLPITFICFLERPASLRFSGLATRGFFILGLVVFGRLGCSLRRPRGSLHMHECCRPLSDMLYRCVSSQMFLNCVMFVIAVDSEQGVLHFRSSPQFWLFKTLPWTALEARFFA